MFRTGLFTGWKMGSLCGGMWQTALLPRWGLRSAKFQE